MARSIVFAILVPCLIASVCCEDELLLPGPKVLFKSEGGSIRVWESSGALEKYAAVTVDELTLESGGLLLPKYENAHALGYVIEGRARVGVATPLGLANVHQLKQGDVFAIPEGANHGAFNDHKERFRMIVVTDRREQGRELKTVIPFFLMGNPEDKPFGSVLNGFTKDVLAAAWGVDEDTVEKLLTSQKGAAIIKLELPADADARPDANTPLGDFSFNLDDTQAEIMAEGGSSNFVNEFKLPILKAIGLSAGRANLKPNALIAPAYFTNAHQIVYFTAGRGRIQIAAPGGSNALDREVEAGQVVVIPKHFPATTLAAKDSPLEWITFFTSPTPVSYFLAGANSVFKMMPFDVLVKGFNVDPELERKFLAARTDEAIILTRHEKRAEVSMGTI